jgi:Flp pilus assembly protein TadG
MSVPPTRNEKMSKARNPLIANASTGEWRTGRIPRHYRRRLGMVLIYTLIAMTLITGMICLAVDVAHIKTVKHELMIAVDAAAHHGASNLPISTADVQNAAIATAAANSADGSSVTLNAATDVIIGTWDSSTKTFSAGGYSPNAVRVIARRSSATGNPIRLSFASLFGVSTKDTAVSATACLVSGGVANSSRSNGIMNPWLAGMSAGSYGGATGSGTAPENSPGQVTGLTLTAGGILKFNVTGSCADDPVNVNQNWTPDGEPGGYRTNDSGYLNGMSNLNTQQGALVGVFLDNFAPNVSPAPTPPDLMMNSQAAMDYTSLSPNLKQPFFIGDGKTSGGVQQQIVVPAGATRLFLGIHDNINWSNNSGYFLVTINGANASIATVE